MDSLCVPLGELVVSRYVKRLMNLTGLCRKFKISINKSEKKKKFLPDDIYLEVGSVPLVLPNLFYSFRNIYVDNFYYGILEILGKRENQVNISIAYLYPICFNLQLFRLFVC